MEKLKRNLEVRARELLKQFPILVLIGARQVGKTELAKKLGPTWKYFDLENPSDLERIQIDPDYFFISNPDSLILDEAQEFTGLFKILRGVVDRNRGHKGRFILTGSSSPQLLKNISESLAGRVATLEVGTLKANEYYQKPLSPFYQFFLSEGKGPILEHLVSLSPSLSISEMQNFWFYGGFPEPVIAHDLGFYRHWMQEYQKTYIERDIRRLFPRINTQRYRKFISILAELSGTILNRSELASVLSVSQPTITQYLGIADGTFIWRILPSFSRSKSKSIVKMPKGFVRDSGLLHFLKMIPDIEALLHLPIMGRSFESFVIEEVLKGLESSAVVGWNYSYYRTRSRAEVDLILEGQFGLIPIEIKFSSKVDGRDLTNLNAFMKEYKAPFGLLINQSDCVQKLSSNIIQIPIGLI